MDFPALLAQALAAVKGNQAELARRLGRSETTISRWANSRSGIDYESCLRLARITGIPAKTVLTAAGLDPNLLIDGDLTAMQRDVMARMARIQDAIEATAGIPDDFVDVYLRTQLDNTEAEIMATLELLRQQRKEADKPAQVVEPVPPTRPGRRRVTKPPEEFGRAKMDQQIASHPRIPQWRRELPETESQRIARDLRPAFAL